MYTAETRVQSVKSNTNNSTWRLGVVGQQWQEQEKQKRSGRMKHASLPGIFLQDPVRRSYRIFFCIFLHFNTKFYFCIKFIFNLLVIRDTQGFEYE